MEVRWKWMAPNSHHTRAMMVSEMRWLTYQKCQLGISKKHVRETKHESQSAEDAVYICTKGSRQLSRDIVSFSPCWLFYDTFSAACAVSKLDGMDSQYLHFTNMSNFINETLYLSHCLQVSRNLQYKQTEFHGQ